jgi:hypothetical protein
MGVNLQSSGHVPPGVHVVDILIGALSKLSPNDIISSKVMN